jgi:hypothetical protein
VDCAQLDGAPHGLRSRHWAHSPCWSPRSSLLPVSLAPARRCPTHRPALVAAPLQSLWSARCPACVLFHPTCCSALLARHLAAPAYQLFCVSASVPALGLSTLTVGTLSSHRFTAPHSPVRPSLLPCFRPAVLHFHPPSSRPRPSIAPDRRLVNASSCAARASAVSQALHTRPTRMGSSLLVRPPHPH